MTPASDKTTIPPTLLRLPDLDPEASSMLQAVQTAEPEMVSSAATPSPAAKSKATSSAGLPKSSSPKPAHFVERSAVGLSSSIPKEETRDQPVEQSESPSLRESELPQAVREDVPIADANFPNDESDSWLTTFASRKTLLVLLAIVAGLAIFFPRGENATSEQGTPLLVEESAPEPTVIPFQMERYPATRLDSPIASSSQPINPHQKLADSSKVMPPSQVSAVSVPLRQPRADEVNEEIISVVQQPSSMVPQPPKTPWDEPAIRQPDGDPLSESLSTSSGPLDDTVLFAPNEQGSPYQQTLSPESPLLNPFQFAGNNAPDPPVQSMVNGIGGDSAALDKKSETPARLVNSRTPQGIFNWKKFLPPINNDADSATSASPNVDQNTNGTSVMSEIRTSKAPVAPSFEFALPGGVNQTSNPSGSPSSGPEARVAMPPQSSLR